MANNRMYLKCVICGETVYIARSNSCNWQWAGNESFISKFFDQHQHNSKKDYSRAVSVEDGMALIYESSPHFIIEYEQYFHPPIETITKYYQTELDQFE